MEIYPGLLWDTFHSGVRELLCIDRGKREDLRQRGTVVLDIPELGLSTSSYVLWSSMVNAPKHLTY